MRFKNCLSLLKAFSIGERLDEQVGNQRIDAPHCAIKARIVKENTRACRQACPGPITHPASGTLKADRYAEEK